MLRKLMANFAFILFPRDVAKFTSPQSPILPVGKIFFPSWRDIFRQLAKNSVPSHAKNKNRSKHGKLFHIVVLLFQ